jgi:hypothetical protein
MHFINRRIHILFKEIQLILITIYTVVQSQVSTDTVEFPCNNKHLINQISWRISFDVYTSIVSKGEGNGYVGADHFNIINNSLGISCNPSMVINENNLYEICINYQLKRFESDDLVVAPGAISSHSISFYNFLSVTPAYERLFNIYKEITIGTQFGLNLRYPLSEYVEYPSFFFQPDITLYFKRFGLTNKINISIFNNYWEDEIISYFIGVRFLF